jgi:cytochrome c-type biogenesis protein CcmH
MTTFWIVAGLLLAGALLFVVPPLAAGSRRRVHAATQREANVNIYRDQLAELDADLAAGTISEEQYGQARREVESRVLEDVSGDAAASPAPVQPAGSRLPAIAVGVAVPVLAIAFYLVIGNPKGLPRPGSRGTR